MIKPIKGSWVQFQFPKKPEIEHWNIACVKASEQDWREKIREMRDIGMEYLVLMSSAFQGYAYFDTDIYPPADIACKNPIEVLLDEAEKQGMKVFLSAGHYGEWTKAKENFTSGEVTARAFRAVERLYGLFGGYNSFYGWYLPDESWINGYFDLDYIGYVNRYSQRVKSIDAAKKLLIAPYGACNAVVDDEFIRRLALIECDFIAYQDEVGVQKATPHQTRRYFEALKTAHDKAGGSALWADVELFDYEGAPYRSRLFSGPFERVREQLESVSDYAENILVYTYQFLMSKSEKDTLSDGAGAKRLYEDYCNFFGIQE